MTQKTRRDEGLWTLWIPLNAYMVPWAGLEPATSRLGGGRSIHLSYQGGANPSYYKARAERFSGRIVRDTVPVSSEAAGNARNAVAVLARKFAYTRSCS